MLLNRSIKLAAVATAFLATVAVGDASANWREKIKVLKIGSVTVENQAATVTRYKPFAEYLEKKLGVKVEVFTASDYAGIVQALSAGQFIWRGWAVRAMRRDTSTATAASSHWP